MKPISLELQAFGPFVERQTVDFEALSRSGMFLITGKTGSGKTSIFDAMTVALYGGGTGDAENIKNGRNDLEEWRCTQAGRELPTVVSFTFEVRGHRYVFTRRLIPKRKNLSASYEAGELDDGGNVIPFFENPKKDDLRRKAEELIGLNKEQFRQVVLLPQGQFERFLTASSSEKEAILTKIFATGRWARYAECFYREAEKRHSALRDEKAYIERSLAEEGQSSVSGLEEHIASLRTRREAARQEHTAFGGAEKQERLNADRTLAERFKPLNAGLARLEQLRALAGDIERARAKYGAACRAESLRTLFDDLARAEKEYEKRSTAHESLLAQLPGKKSAAESAQKKLSEHCAASPVETLQKRIGEYEAKRPAYESFGALSAACAEAGSAAAAAREYSEAMQLALSTAVQSAKRLYADFEAASELARDYRRRYFAGIYGDIAQSLSDGEKCPVCGSTSHPEPAERAPDSVSKKDVEAQEKRAEKAEKLWKKSESDRASAQEKSDGAARSLAEREAAASEKRAELAAASANLTEGIEDLAALDAATASLRDRVARYNAETERLRGKSEESSSALRELTAQTEAAEQEKQRAAETMLGCGSALDEAVAQAGEPSRESARSAMLTSEERSKLYTRLVEYEKELRDTEAEIARLSAELEGQSEPDGTRFEERQRGITEELREFEKNDAALGAGIDRLSEKLSSLVALAEHYESGIALAEEDLAFARSLRGDSGIGLSRYVLAVMFGQVIAEANRMLERVHGGRYRLFRSDEKGRGNKRGLELKVYDNRAPEAEGRSVAMLSGGEKFLVSLALSIGMSTVAQSSGVRIEALFIDEGFGTLDGSSIYDAMNVLESVRKSSGVIGIISHVRLLEENIPTRLEIVKTDSGSRISAV